MRGVNGEITRAVYWRFLVANRRPPRRRKPCRIVFEIEIRQGLVYVTANNFDHATRQAKSLEWDLAIRGVRNHTEILPGIFCLGQAARDYHAKVAERMLACG